jgi:general secretion pathway protein K
MKSQQSGVALVLVLWVITLLAVIAGNFAYSMRSEALISRNLMAAAQAQAVADAGVQMAWFELTKPPADPQRWTANGLVRTVGVNGAALKIVIGNEYGKIDINKGMDALRDGLFRSVGLSAEFSSGLLARLKLATAIPFESVDELRQVEGVTPEIYRLLAPSLTVYSGLPKINIASASRDVLMAIPGVNPAAVEQYLALRKVAMEAGQPLPVFAEGSQYDFNSGGRVTYSVASIATLPDGTVAARKAVGRFTNNPHQPVQVLVWSDVLDPQPTSAPTIALN